MNTNYFEARAPLDMKKLDEYIRKRVDRNINELTRQIARVLGKKDAKSYRDYVDEGLTPAVSARQRQKIFELIERFRVATPAEGQIPHEIRVVPAEPHKILALWLPEGVDVRLTKRGIDSPSEPERGVIQVVTCGNNVLNELEHGVAAHYAAVHVDQVMFWQQDRDTKQISYLPGQYIRIESPQGPHGAVVLPISVPTREVLLVSQFRHSVQKFMLECPRGFAFHADKKPFDTARRELEEETGLTPGSLINLRELVVDSGKLTDEPYYFLATVDRDSYHEKVIERKGIRESPVWVPLDVFYEALWVKAGVQLVASPFDIDFLHARQPYMTERPDWQTRSVVIRDAFSVTAGMLALPLLMRDYVPDQGFWRDLMNRVAVRQSSEAAS